MTLHPLHLSKKKKQFMMYNLFSYAFFFARQKFDTTRYADVHKHSCFFMQIVFDNLIEGRNGGKKFSKIKIKHGVIN